MKLSPLTVLTLAALAAACGTEDAIAPRPAGTSEAPPPVAATTPPTRKLMEGAALPTSAVNLITDPGFILATQKSGFGSFLAFEEASLTPVDLATTFDSRAPFPAQWDPKLGIHVT